MAIDYLTEFPIPAERLPARLRGLLTPVGLDPRHFVEVACISEHDPHGPERECVHLQMAVVPGAAPSPVPVLNEAGQGVVSYSIPAGHEIGCCADFAPSLTGNDYIVASWGSGSFYSFGLAEKVWMTLGLSPRCVGNEDQRLIYDDLELPEFGVVDGRVSSDYHFTLKRDVTWRMSNEYLRRYLWLRGARGVRSFFYEASVPEAPELRALMNGKSHTVLSPEGTTAWYVLDLREHKGRLLIQLWASVEAVIPVRCPEHSADGIQWPGHEQPMTYERANALIEVTPVYLDDKFLIQYEQNSFYESTPFFCLGAWHCSPSYRGQWSFTKCQRVGRNLIKVPMRELYKPKPDREIAHARRFAIDPALLAGVNFDEEHVVAKVQRLLDALLHLGDGLSVLGTQVGLAKSAVEIVGFDRAQIAVEGWRSYPTLGRLAQVAPLDMTQQAFLARCKGLHEVWQRIPNGFLKGLLELAGCPRAAVQPLASIKLLQGLFNVVERLNEHEERIDAFRSGEEPERWHDRNELLAPLFLNNDLRIADAHDSFANCLATLQSLGFDVGNINAGYGRALDFVMDGVIASLDRVALVVNQFVARR